MRKKSVWEKRTKKVAAQSTSKAREDLTNNNGQNTPHSFSKELSKRHHTARELVREMLSR